MSGNVFVNPDASSAPLQVELKGAPKPLPMTSLVGKGSLGQSTGDGAEEM